jgi:uncharacterized protein YecE (DUF72 family)
MAGRIRVGVGGWTYEPWRGTFYPESLVQKRELEYAASRLTSIEINGTFYGSQKPATFAKWHDETPDDFVFSLKAPRYATHRRVLGEAGPTIERFLRSGLLELKDKLGPINWQLMPNTKFVPEDFEAFLKLLPPEHEGHALRHAVEVRHVSFKVPQLAELARKYGVAIVVAGDSQEYPMIDEVTAPFAYARIMGTREGEKLGYSRKALDSWAERMKSWAAGKKGRDVFLYVISGHKVANPAAAQALIERLS